MSKRLLFDLETDGLLDELTTVHCAWSYDLDSEEWKSYTPETAHLLWRDLAEADELWGHNIISFDLPALKKVYGESEGFDNFWRNTYLQGGTRVFDTMVMSRLVWSDIMSSDMENLARGRLALPPDEPKAKKALLGSHSLRAWGYRLGVLKGKFPVEDFSTFSDEMLEYNRQDVLVNLALCKALEKKVHHTHESVFIEHKFYEYLDIQQKTGVAFDSELANFLVKYWQKELDKRTLQMKALVPDIVLKEWFTPKVNSTKYGYRKGEPFQKVKVIPFNPRSGDHVASFLITKYGWEPAELTKTGKPKVTYEILRHLPYVEAPLLARIQVLMDRIGLVSTERVAWLKCVKNGRIHGGIIHNGTNTHRCRHFQPNLGNIPSPKSLWGKTMRKLFMARKGTMMLGIDFDGLEMRMLADALWPYDGGAFYEMAFNGSKEQGTDAHSLNLKVAKEILRQAGFKMVSEKLTRDKIKTTFYAYLYGAWPRKIGQTACTGLDIHPAKFKRIGVAIKEAFEKNIKGLSDLIKDLEATYEECLANKVWPTLEGLDGRRIPVRKKSALLNTLLQARGAIAAKWACVRLLIESERLGFRVGEFWWPVLHVHDEIEIEVTENADRERITKFEQLVVECFADVSRRFGLKVEIIGSLSKGKRWSDTH